MKDKASRGSISKKIIKPSENEGKTPIPDEPARAFAFTEWLGALARWVLCLGSKSFNDLYQPKDTKKNFIIGYLLTIVFAVAVFASLILFMD